jgi:hypothetical protein
MVSDSSHGLAVGRGMRETEFKEVQLKHTQVSLIYVIMSGTSFEV